MDENLTPTPGMLPVPGTTKYYFAPGADGETRIFSVASKKFLARSRYGLRWRSQIQLDSGRSKWVYLDDTGAVSVEDEVAALMAKGARALPGFPDFVMLPTTEIFRINPAERGPSAGGVKEVVVHYRSGSPYVQLPAKYGRRSTFSVGKLHHKLFGPSAPVPSESPV
jgi:hypothetical protein